MANPFEIVVQKLVELGFYDFFFPFVITAAIIYALLRKTKTLGDNPTTNGIVAISIAFLIFGFPVLTNITLGLQLSTFFTQATIFILIFVLAMIIAGAFYPDLTKVLMEHIRKPIILYIMIVIAILVFLTSGLLTAFTNIGNPLVTGEERGSPIAPTEVFIIVAAVIVFIVVIFVAAAAFGGKPGGD